MVWGSFFMRAWFGYLGFGLHRSIPHHTIPYHTIKQSHMFVCLKCTDLILICMHGAGVLVQFVHWMTTKRSMRLGFYFDLFFFEWPDGKMGRWGDGEIERKKELWYNYKFMSWSDLIWSLNWFDLITFLWYLFLVRCSMIYFVSNWIESNWSRVRYFFSFLRNAINHIMEMYIHTCQAGYNETSIILYYFYWVDLLIAKTWLMNECLVKNVKFFV